MSMPSSPASRPAPLLSRHSMHSLAARAAGMDGEGRTFLHIIAWGVCIVVASTIMGFGH
ncbi:MAG TPA: hypothetical protein VKU41_23050 [Polyangiaceae bacterium]|nr:hypothetical protein [Polyangiaceae bacterium]